MFKSTKTTVALLLGLLVLELSILAWFNPVTRLLVYRALGGFPLLKIALSFSGLLGIFALTRARDFPAFHFGLGCQRWIPIHLVATGVLGLLINGLEHQVLNESSPTKILSLALPSLAFFVTWLRSLLPFGDWPKLLKEVGLELGVMVLIAVALGPLADIAEKAFTGGVLSLTFDSCRAVGGILFDEVVSQPDEQLFGTPNFTIFIHHTCSGYEGVALITFFLAIYLLLRRESLNFPKALIIIPIGVVTSWFCNIGRIVGLVAVGTYFSPTIALGAFHSNAGWLSFVLLGLFFVTVLEGFQIFQKETSRNSDYPSLAFLLPLISQLLFTLFFAAFSPDFDIYYPVRVMLVFLILHALRHQLTGQEFEFTPSRDSLLIGVAVYAIWVTLLPSTPSNAPAMSVALAGLWICFRILGSVVIVPIVEELAFRGYLLRRLQDVDFENVPPGRLTASSVLLSSLCFGLLHSAVLAGTIAGIAYAYATRLRGKLSDAIFAHGVTNLLIALHVLIGGRWDLWL